MKTYDDCLEACKQYYRENKKDLEKDSYLNDARDRAVEVVDNAELYLNSFSDFAEVCASNSDIGLYNPPPASGRPLWELQREAIDNTLYDEMEEYIQEQEEQEARHKDLNERIKGV